MDKKILRCVLFFSIILFCVGCDQVTKQIAKKYLQPQGDLSFCLDTFRLQYAENSGAFLSFGSAFTPQVRFYVFTILNSIFLLALTIWLFYHWQTHHYMHFSALCFILAGGIGNIIDRVLNNGKVIDFLNIGIGSLRTGIFNVADMVVMLGMLLLIWKFNEEQEPQESSNLA